jgi:hypothetical protein
MTTLLVVLCGCAIAFLVLAGGGLQGARRWWHALAFGPAAGLGLLSLCVFYWRVFGLPRPRLWHVVTILVISLGILAARVVTSEKPPRATASWRLTPGDALACGALLAALALLLAYHATTRRVWPEGTWDAVAIWNVRARFLERGYERFPELLAQVPADSHPHYPLLLPAAVAGQEMLFTGEDGAIAPTTGLAFVLGLGLLVFAVVRDAGGTGVAAFAAAFLWSTPVLVKWSGAQGADLPAAYFFLATVAVLASHLGDRGAAPLPIGWGGVCLGLLAWVKNEGVVMAALALGLFTVWLWSDRSRRLSFWRTLAWLVAGALPGFLALILFKSLWAPESGLETFLQGAWQERLLAAQRWWLPLRSILAAPFGWVRAPLEGWGLAWPVLMAGTLLVGWVWRRGCPRWAGYWGSVLLAVVGSWIPFYAASPYELAWHIGGSLERLLLQVYPALACGLFLAVSEIRHSDEHHAPDLRPSPVGTDDRWRGRRRRQG